MGDRDCLVLHQGLRRLELVLGRHSQVMPSRRSHAIAEATPVPSASWSILLLNTLNQRQESN